MYVLWRVVYQKIWSNTYALLKTNLYSKQPYFQV